MTLDQAKTTLREGGTFAQLGEAIAAVVESPQSSIVDLLFGLKHPGLVAEQAAFALYRKRGRQLPTNHREVETDLRRWIEWLETDEAQSAQASNSTATRAQREALLAAIMELPRKERLILILYYYEGISLDDVARILDLDPSEMPRLHRSILRQVRQRLVNGERPVLNLLSDLVAVRSE